MIRDELHQFFQYHEQYKNMCCELLDNLDLHESTVVAIIFPAFKTRGQMVVSRRSNIWNYRSVHFTPIEY